MSPETKVVLNGMDIQRQIFPETVSVSIHDLKKNSVVSSGDTFRIDSLDQLDDEVRTPKNLNASHPLIISGDRTCLGSGASKYTQFKLRTDVGTGRAQLVVMPSSEIDGPQVLDCSTTERL